MFPTVLWIIGVYAAVAAIAHWAIRRRTKAWSRRHYVLVAGNHQSQIEGYIRALQQYSHRTGTDIGITVVLKESSDHTAAILSAMSRRFPAIGLVRDREGRGDETASAAAWPGREDRLVPAARSNSNDTMDPLICDVDFWLRTGRKSAGQKPQTIWVELDEEGDFEKKIR